jgi:succinyl-CoA synthetase alpha subunit
MAILLDRDTRVVVQGITGREGSFHALRNKGYGTQVVAGGVQGDRPDVVVGNKKGTFVFLHRVKSVNRSQWEASQPKPIE